MKNLLKIIIYKCFYPFYYKHHTRKQIASKIILLEPQQKKLSNVFFVLQKELERDYNFDIKIHALKKESFFGAIKSDLCFLKDFATAKYLFTSDGCRVLACVKKREGTVVTNLWHGCGAFKKFGFSTCDVKFGNDKDEMLKFPYYKNNDYATVSSPEVVWAYKEAMNAEHFGIDVVATGVSRTDIFFDKDYIERAKNKLHDIFPQAKRKKVILYAPTFRGEPSSAKAPTELDVSSMAKELKDEYVLVTMHHPFVAELPKISKDCSDFAADLSKHMLTDEMMCVCDICISDYSSLVFEYSLFQKPMVFFAYDIDEYNDWRGFFYPYDEFTPAPISKTTAELITTIKQADFDKEKITAFREKFMYMCDGNATKRILDLVITKK